MPVYAVTGKLGSGKTLVAVSRIKHFLNRGRRVATNLDLNLENLINPKAKKSVVYRLPDVPSVDDFKNIGLGYDGKIQGDHANGLIVLDECAKWLNSRAWNDKSRRALIDYFIHLRKKRWDLIIIIQDIEALDKQFRDLYCEHIVYCSRSDRYNIPFIGGLLKLCNGGDKISLPRMHVGNVNYCVGNGKQVHVENWFYRGTGLFSAYDTEQGFSEETSPKLSTFIPPYYIKGRYINELEELKKAFRSIKAWHLFLVGVLLGGSILNAMTPDGHNPKFGTFTCNADWEELFGNCDLKPHQVKEIFNKHNESISSETGSRSLDLAPDGEEIKPVHVLDGVHITASVRSSNGIEYYFTKHGFAYNPKSDGYRVVTGSLCNALLSKADNFRDSTEIYCE